MSRKVSVTRGPASAYASPGESILEFSDGQSGGLLGFMRDEQGRLVVDLFRLDADVVVRTPDAHLYVRPVPA